MKKRGEDRVEELLGSMVLVEWVDARGGYTEWDKESDGYLDDGVAHVLTIGFLLRKDRDRITLVMNVGDPKAADRQMNCLMHIPRSAVRRIDELAKRSARKGSGVKRK